MNATLPLLLAGLAAGLSLIVAIGAQNAYVLRQGLTGRYVGAVVGICIGADVLLITAGRRGDPPIIGVGGQGAFADPLPQALALTAIVITFGVTALLFALAFRSWLLTRDDE